MVSMGHLDDRLTVFGLVVLLVGVVALLLLALLLAATLLPGELLGQRAPPLLQLLGLQPVIRSY